MSFKLSPPVPPNIPEDKVYSINDFNNYFEQLQRIISTHDDSLSTVISAMVNYFPFSMNPATINTNLANGIYYITEQVNGTFPFENVGNSCFLISISNGSSSTQFLFDYSGIYSRRNSLSTWKNISGSSVIDSLTSTSIIDSLSANQGRLLNDKKLDRFIYSGEESADIDSLAEGIYTFNNAQVSGSFPEFSQISEDLNMFTVKVYGNFNSLCLQELTDSISMTFGFRVGYLVTSTEGKIWEWSDWKQVVTSEDVSQIVEESLNEKLEDLIIDCGEF